ncbi:MAG: hypothetical protein AAB606_05700 [Patescibacteria group bacterium]
MYRRVPLSVEVPRVLQLLIYTLLGLLVMTSAYFFFKTSNTAERGYSMRENQIRQQNLESENRILKQKVLDVQSLSELRASDVVKDLEEPNSPTFVEPKGPLTRRE